MNEDRDWVEKCIGGVVRDYERLAAGKSRATWLVDVDVEGTVRHLVLRRDTGDGPLSGTEFDLARERTVYDALRDSGLPVPRLVGSSPDGSAFLLERIEGTEDLNGLDPEALRTVTDSFVDAVADLHRLDAREFDLAGWSQPLTPTEQLRLDLATWRRILDERVTRPAPLVRLVLDWLDANAPVDSDRTVLCHGDVGPGNFLHDGTAVTALLDWEFAHLGDPMDDLAWLTIRCSQLAPAVDLDGALARYESVTGITLNWDRVRLYQLAVLVRMAISCMAALDNRRGGMDVSTHLMLLPLAERQMVCHLARIEGRELEPVPPVVPAPSSDRDEILAVVASDIPSSVIPDLQSESVRAHALGLTMLVGHLRTADTLGAPVDASELDELEALLGKRPDTISAGLRAVERLNAEGELSSTEVLDYMNGLSARTMQLWPMLAPIAERPLPDGDT